MPKIPAKSRIINNHKSYQFVNKTNLRESFIIPKLSSSAAQHRLSSCKFGKLNPVKIKLPCLLLTSTLDTSSLNRSHHLKGYWGLVIRGKVVGVGWVLGTFGDRYWLFGQGHIIKGTVGAIGDGGVMDPEWRVWLGYKITTMIYFLQNNNKRALQALNIFMALDSAF